MRLLTRLRGFLCPEGVLCLGCGCAVQGEALCHECRAALTLQRLKGALCPMCGQPLEQDGACGMCARGWQLQARSAWRHDGLARTLVHRLKYEGIRAAADALAEGMLEDARGLIGDADAAVTWLPMPVSRFREREFDHARLIAERLACRMDLPVKQALRRVEANGSIRHQVGSSAEERVSNLRGTFAAAAEVRGTLLLIDDVMTTGASAALARECLLQGGAGRVLVLTATRALGRMTMTEGETDDV